jgi:TatA/E family protein of Tat protein translocase
MNFLGMGPGEILVVMLLAMVVFGPGKLPEIGQGLGRAIRQFRAATSEITEEFNRELNIEKMLQDPPKQPAPAPAPTEPLSQAVATIASAAEATPANDAPEQPVSSVALEALTPGRPVITVAGDEDTAPSGAAATESAAPAAESAGPVALDPLPAEYPYGEIVSRSDATQAAPEAPVKPVEDAPEAVAEPKNQAEERPAEQKTTEGTRV